MANEDDPDVAVQAAVRALNAATARAWATGAHVSVSVFLVHAPDKGAPWPVVQAMLTPPGAVGG